MVHSTSIFLTDFAELRVVEYHFLMYSDSSKRYGYFKVWNEPSNVRLFYLQDDMKAKGLYVNKNDAISAMITYMKSAIKHLKEELNN